MEKLVLSLVTALRKLRPYFQAHFIELLTNFLRKYVLQKIDTSGHLLKWTVELSEFDLSFKPRSTIKGQTSADFMAKFARAPKIEAIIEPVEPPRGIFLLLVH